MEVWTHLICICICFRYVAASPSPTMEAVFGGAPPFVDSIVGDGEKASMATGLLVKELGQEPRNIHRSTYTYIEKERERVALKLGFFRGMSIDFPMVVHCFFNGFHE